MNEPGGIYSREAYALGKMLDHSSWYREEPKLPRRIRPSDIDYPIIPLVFDNNGWLLMCELSRHCSKWNELSTGQRWLYESVIAHTQKFAVLCTHNVTPQEGRLINSRHDVQSFQIMLWDWGYVFSPVILGNARWQHFVLDFYRSDRPAFIRKYVIGGSIRMQIPERRDVANEGSA